jgi:hypothetical protein
MSIFTSYLLSLVVIHALWLYFFATGQLLWPKRCSQADSVSLVELVATSAAGMALTGFGLLVLGFVHFLRPIGVFVGLIIEGILFWRLRDENCCSLGFWRFTIRRMVNAWTAPALFLYLLFLALALPAVLPPAVSDSVTYHLAYALEWANAGRIHVDPFLRFPFYANNFLLLYSGLFALNLGDCCQFLTWLCGLLTCLGVLAFLAPGKSPEWFIPWPLRAGEFIIPMTVALSPVFLRYLNVGMPDVPIGLFLLVPILCAFHTSTQRPLERELVVTAGFCVGMKLTLIGHLPFFLASLLFAAKTRHLPRRSVALLCLVFVALGLPWYLRNLVETHDPVPPIVNTLLKRPDPIFNGSGVDVYTPQTPADPNPVHLASIPFRFFSDPTSKTFHEYAVPALFLCVYAVPLVLLASLVLRKRWHLPKRIQYLSLGAVYFVLPWLFCPLGRYSLHWYPVLAASTGVVLFHFWQHQQLPVSRPVRTWIINIAVATGSVLLLCPSPTGPWVEFYQNFYADCLPLFASRQQLREYVRHRVRDYPESQAVIETLAFNRQSGSRVLIFGPGTPAYFFRKAKITSVGDYFGPAEYKELIAEIHRGNCLPYLRRLKIAAIIVDPRFKTALPKVCWLFRNELEQDGFVEYRYRGDPIPVFLRSDLKASRKLSPAPCEERLSPSPARWRTRADSAIPANHGVGWVNFAGETHGLCLTYRFDVFGQNACASHQDQWCAPAQSEESARRDSAGEACRCYGLERLG